MGIKHSIFILKIYPLPFARIPVKIDGTGIFEKIPQIVQNRRLFDKPPQLAAFSDIEGFSGELVLQGRHVSGGCQQLLFLILFHGFHPFISQIAFRQGKGKKSCVGNFWPHTLLSLLTLRERKQVLFIIRKFPWEKVDKIIEFYRIGRKGKSFDFFPSLWWLSASVSIVNPEAPVLF